MGFLHRLFGERNKQYSSTKKTKDSSAVDWVREVPDETGTFICSVDRLQSKFKEFSRVGESVKLWIPKENDPDEVYIYHRDGPGGCLGFVPLEYSNIVISHLKNGLDYYAEIVELGDKACKIKCRLISKEESKDRQKKDKESLKKELTKVYIPKNPITLMLAIKKKDMVKKGEKLVIEFNDLDSYLKDVGNQRGPYSSQWNIKFLDNTGKTIGILDHNKNTIKKILRAHFNSYLLNVEVIDTFDDVDYSEEKKRSNWKGYPIKLSITPFKK